MTLAIEPDVEAAAVAWAKSQSDLVNINGAGVATRLPRAHDPRTDSAAWSTFLRAALLVGSEVVYEGGSIVAGVIQWDAYAQNPSGRAPDYAAASALARTLKAAAYGASAVDTGAGVILGFGSFNGPHRIEEPETQFARFMVETLLVVRA